MTTSMKKVIKKTREEIEGSEQLTPIKVSDTNYYYWVCDECKVAFFDSDIILKSSKSGCKCPIEKTRGFIGKLFNDGKIICGNSIYGGDKECFEKYYKLNE